MEGLKGFDNFNDLNLTGVPNGSIIVMGNANCEPHMLWVQPQLPGRFVLQEGVTGIFDEVTYIYKGGKWVEYEC